MVLPTSLDLYKELQAVTPDSLQYLAHDLFEANTHWDLKMEQATATETEDGSWLVRLKVEARKSVVDSYGHETEGSLADWIEIGIFAPAGEEEERGELLYRQMHRLTAPMEEILVEVHRKPGAAGIDPDFLLNDWKMDDNYEEVERGEKVLSREAVTLAF